MVTDAFLIVNGQQSTMTAQSASTFETTLNGAFTNPTAFSVYMIEAGTPGGFASTVLFPPNYCTVTGDVAVSVSDVQKTINEALGVIPAVNDLNGDGVVNVIDVQIVRNAALNLGCAAK